MTNYQTKLIPSIKVVTFAFGGLLLAQGCGPEFDAESDLSLQSDDAEQTSLKPDAEGIEAEEGDLEVSEQSLYHDGCSGRLARIAGGFLVDPLFFASGRLFYDACVRHDYCYQGGLATYGKSRSTCDNEFKDQMKEKCKKDWKKSFIDPTFVPRCLLVANAMYKAVDKHGGSHFKSQLCKNGEIFTSANHDSLNCSAWEPYAGTPSKAPVSCAGTPGQWEGCRGSGCTACTDLLTAYPKYFKNHPYCTPNKTCSGKYYTCNTACPAPSSADR